ncbi:MAG TPA: hypothetical protein PLX35_03475 [Cyclobacteriaceae bacterium]|nr:hypothetical protein [Cyclobacteriaceae bacterium]
MELFAGLVHSWLGAIHLVFSLLSLTGGSFVLLLPKGNRRHKKMGYLYLSSMAIVNASSLGIYRLTGTFGVFHVAAIVDFLTLIGGMIPLFWSGLDRRTRGMHLWFMYYSVLGLYAAFVAEISVRIPGAPFYPTVGLATLVIFGVGTLFIIRKEMEWQKYFL